MLYPCQETKCCAKCGKEKNVAIEFQRNNKRTCKKCVAEARAKIVAKSKGLPTGLGWKKTMSTFCFSVFHKKAS